MRDEIDEPLVSRDDGAQINQATKPRKQWRAPKVIRSDFSSTDQGGRSPVDRVSVGLGVVVIVVVS